MTTPLLERFWRNVKKTEACWIWTAFTDRDGYGYFSTKKGTQVKAHRLAYELYTKSRIPDGLLCCHKCDTPSCVRFDHLFLGTNKDNLADAASKMRMHIGEQHGQSKLTETKVLKIRDLYIKKQMSQNAIAEDFGICQTQVSRLIRRKQWKHI